MRIRGNAYIVNKEMANVGCIVCQTCGDVIDYFEDEKVTVLYGTCCHECECEEEKEAV